MGFDNVCSIIKQIERASSLQIPSYLPFLIHGTSAGVLHMQPAAVCCRCLRESRSAPASPRNRSQIRLVQTEGLNCVDVRKSWNGVTFRASSRLHWQRSRRRFCRVRNDLASAPFFSQTNRVHSAVVTVRARECARPICWRSPGYTVSLP